MYTKKVVVVLKCEIQEEIFLSVKEYWFILLFCLTLVLAELWYYFGVI